MFLRRFTSPSQKDYFYQQYHNLKQGNNSIEEFAHNFQRLRKKIDPTSATPEDGIIRDFMARINPQIKLLVSTTNPTTLQQAIDSARTVEASMGGSMAFMTDNTPLVGMAETLELMANELKDVKEQVRKQPDPHRSWKPSTYRKNSADNYDEPQAWELTKTCFKCGLFGHIAKRCKLSGPISTNPYKARPVHHALAGRNAQMMEYPYFINEPPPVQSWYPPPQQSSSYYYRPQPQQTQVRPPTGPPPSSKNVFNLDMSQRYYTAAKVDARHKLTPIKPIIDSGASVSIITNSLAKKLGIIATKGTNLTYCAIDGEERDVGGIAEKVPIAIGDALVPIDLQLVGSKKDNILLGMDWIKTYGANLLFRTDELEFQYQGRNISIKMTTTAGHVVHIIERPKVEVNMTEWNIDQFLKETSRDGEEDITNQDTKGPEELGWEEYSYDIEEGRTWDDDVPIEPLRESLGKWTEVCFAYRGPDWPECQSSKANPKYFESSQSCSTYDHHSHYYCTRCKKNFNPTGYWKKPKPTDPCDCNMGNQSMITQPMQPPHRPRTIPPLVLGVSYQSPSSPKNRKNRRQICYICRKGGHKAVECLQKESIKPKDIQPKLKDPDEEFREEIWDPRYIAAQLVPQEKEEIKLTPQKISQPISKPKKVSIATRDDDDHLLEAIMNDPDFDELSLNEVYVTEEFQKSLKEPQEDDNEEILQEIRKEIWDQFEDRELPDDVALGQIEDVEFTIELTSTIPVASKPIPVEARHREAFKKEIDYMLKHGVIAECSSEYASNVVIADKPGGKIRVCANYGPLNKLIPQDHYPLPVINELMRYFNGKKWYSIIDAAKGYWQFKIKPEHQKYTAIVTPWGQYKFLVMPFGLNNAPATFQRYMNQTFRKQIGTICLVYMDDIIIFSDTLADHVKHVRSILEIMRKKNIYINRDKCSIVQREIKFLGHRISRDGVKISDDKVKALREIASPKTKKELHSALGLLTWFKKFVKNYSKKTRPLWEIFKSDRFKWSIEAEKVYRDLIEELCNAPILKHPDLNKPFNVYTDASGEGLGAMLTQEETGLERVVEYASKALAKAEKNYPITELECLGVVWAVDKLRHYLGQTPFTIFTDHAALITMQTHMNLTPKRARWLAELQQYQFTIKHIKAEKNGVADGLSRLIPDNITSEEAWTLPGVIRPAQTTFALVVIYDDDYIYLSERLGEPMKGLLQSPGGKVNEEEGSLEAAIRECKEETGIELDPKWTRYITKDTEFDCDVFISKVNEYPRRTEPKKMGEWRPYTFQEYLLRTIKGELTPSHLKFYEKILGKIHVSNMELRIVNDEITWNDKEVAYVGEIAEDYLQEEAIPYENYPPPAYNEPTYNESTNLYEWEPQPFMKMASGTPCYRGTIEIDNKGKTWIEMPHLAPGNQTRQERVVIPKESENRRYYFNPDWIHQTPWWEEATDDYWMQSWQNAINGNGGFYYRY
jgi:hypothetical protein